MSNQFYNADETINIDVTPDLSGVQQAEILNKACIILRLKIHGKSFSKRIASTDVLDPSKKMRAGSVRTTKQFIDPKYLEQINRLDSAIRNRIAYSVALTKPDFIASGSYLIPAGLYAYTDQLLEEYREKRLELLQELREIYPQAKLEFEAANPDLYDETDYPPVDRLEQLFTVEWSAYSVSPPESLKQVSAAVFRREEEKLKAEMSAALDEIKQGLRAGFSELVTSMVAKVRGIGKERRVFTSGFVETFRDFLNTFDAKNLADDRELARLVDDTRKLLDGVSPDAIRNNIEVKLTIENGLGQIERELSNLTEEKVRSVKL